VVTANPQRIKDLYGFSAVRKKNPFSLIPAVIKSDYVLYTGGTPFFDNPGHMALYSFIAVLGRITGSQVVVFGVTLREIRSRLSRMLVRIALAAATYVGGREDRSIEGFKKLANPKKVHYLPDPAIQLQLKKRHVIRDVFPAPFSDLSIPKVGLTLRDFETTSEFKKQHFDDGQGFNAQTLETLYENLADAITALAKDGYQVVFLPMHTHEPDDDIKVASKIVAMLDEKTRESVLLYRDQLGPRQMKSVLGDLRLLLAVRFHAIVLATSLNIPVVTLGYHNKNQDIMKTFGVPEFAKPLFDLKEGDAKRIVYDALEKTEDIKERLADAYVGIYQHFDTELKRILNEN
jgi:polysaccharide pyruvyl transferase WcaK-like protein